LEEGKMSESDSKKVKMSVYVPLNACACTYSHYLDQVMEILLPYRSKVKFEVKNAASKEAEELQIFQNSVVFENYPDSATPIIIKKLAQLERYLSKI
jgi:hypothetical protein